MWVVFPLLSAVSIISAAVAASTAPPECGAVCLAKAITDSPCSPTDMVCICTNTELTQTAEACVLMTCTIRESLSTKNYSMTSCKAPVRDERWSTLWLGMSFFIVSLVTFFLRIISRIVGDAGFYWDDYVMIAAILTAMGFAGLSVPLYLFGLGKDIWTVPFDHITKMLISYYHGEWVYALAVFFTKMSLLLFYLRVFPTKSIRLQVYIVMGVLSIYSALGAVVSIFQCTPVRGAWLYWDGEEKFHCRNRNALGWASAIINMALDIAIMLLPLRPLSKLSISRRKKIQVMLMFTVGIFVTIVSILRLRSLIVFADSHNATWDYKEMGFWSQIEIHVGNVCACMPAIYSLLKKLWPTFIGSKKDTSYAPDSAKLKRSFQPKVRDDISEVENFVPLVDMSHDGSKKEASVRSVEA